MHILVTAGPTREYLDDVRCLTNASTGRMGFACAEAARRHRHCVTLVTGPTELPSPPGIRIVRVTSAREMYATVRRVYPDVDAVIATAAVSDYRPSRRIPGKKKKSEARPSLSLVRNPDILASLGRRKGRRLLVGFALEAGRGRRNALRKYREKNLDLIVLNGPSSLGASRTDAEVHTAQGWVKRFRGATKDRLADWIVRTLMTLKEFAKAK